MKTLNSYINLVIVFFNLVWIVACFVEFSKSFENVYKLGSEQGVTMAACVAGCERRRFCKSAIYHRRAAYCVYTAMDRSMEHVMTRIGTVLISGFHPGVQAGAAVDCGGVTCGNEEVCRTTSSWEQICQVDGCQIPVAYSQHLTGNMRSVGSKLIYTCLNTTIVCGPEGKWEAITPLAFRDCEDSCGISQVYSDVQKPFDCDLTTLPGNWLVFQRRQDGSVDFRRNWTEYRNGFGQPSGGEFWLGLEYLYQIVGGGGYELRIDLEDWSGNTRVATYSSFSISGEADNYRLTVSGYAGDAGDDFTSHNGFQFSTYDVDNDVWVNACADVYGAWWHGACHDCDLNGVYHNGDYSAAYGTSIVWGSWRGFEYSLKTTEMKIRRK